MTKCAIGPCFLGIGLIALVFTAGVEAAPLPLEKPRHLAYAAPLPKPRPEELAPSPLPKVRPEGPHTPLPTPKPEHSTLHDPARSRDADALLPRGRPLRTATLPPPAPIVSSEPCAAVDRGTVEAAAIAPIREPDGGCVVPQAFELTKAGAGEGVALTPAATLTCGMIDAVDRFFTDVVQPQARKHLGGSVVGAVVAASFVCRRRNNVAAAKLSEHGRANAIDISRFELADGRSISVSEHWDSKGGKGAFLRAIHAQGCGPFTTVIGPDGDRFHRHHFHFDLIARGRDGQTTWCR